MNENNENQAWEEEFDSKFPAIHCLPNKFSSGYGGYDGGPYIKDFIRTLRQKDKERLMEGVCKMKHEIDPTINAKIQIGQISAYTEFIDLLNQIYE